MRCFLGAGRAIRRCGFLAAGAVLEVDVPGDADVTGGADVPDEVDPPDDVPVFGVIVT